MSEVVFRTVNVLPPVNTIQARPWYPISYPDEPPQTMDWGAFLERFCPNDTPNERLNMHCLRVGDLFGLARVEDSDELTNFVGGTTERDSTQYVVLPARFVERWHEIYRAVRIAKPHSVGVR